MQEQADLYLPVIQDNDIQWVTELLGLPDKAFFGADGNDIRAKILKNNKSLDIEACPGSGKTTLLVSKLAILAKNWVYQNKGICVLSHTNVARKQIEENIGNTVIGERLLKYPHFIGTIHSFINEFLALPWLRSKNNPIHIIDDDITINTRWNKLSWGTKSALERKRKGKNLLKVLDYDYSVGQISWGKNGNLRKTTPTYRNIVDICKKSSEAGYFCYDEMFVWAKELLEYYPYVISAIRERFPILFIDEVQDNSEIQSSLIHKIFIEGENCVIRQRLGDSNQAIYQSISSKDIVSTDKFPKPDIRISIPNSYRFNQEIADLAKPLALNSDELLGHGPLNTKVRSNSTGKNSIFLFSHENIKNLLPAFSSYLIDIFTQDELDKGSFRAVGAIHNYSEDERCPKHVGDYWPSYNPIASRTLPKPKSFIVYLQLGYSLTKQHNNFHYFANYLAEAILRLVKINTPALKIQKRKRSYSYVLSLLKDDYEITQIFKHLSLHLSEINYSNQNFNLGSDHKENILSIVKFISGQSEINDEALAFLNSYQEIEQDIQPDNSFNSDNIFKYPVENPKVNVKIGSVHSVKGETHTAILIMDTFFHDFNLKSLKLWLTGNKTGMGNEGLRNQTRLKWHYVAMTRPTHLLSLAIRKDHIETTDIIKLKDRGWKIFEVLSDNTYNNI